MPEVVGGEEVGGGEDDQLIGQTLLCAQLTVDF
jgi:hypothetical protein